MRGIIATLASFCIIFAASHLSYSQNYSGTIKTFPNEPSMLNHDSNQLFSINSKKNESKDEGCYYVYFTYSSNYGKIKPGYYKIRILKHVGSRMKEMFYTIEVKNDAPSFYDVVVFRKGVYSIRIYDSNDVLLGYSNYFNVTKDTPYTEFADK